MPDLRRADQTQPSIATAADAAAADDDAAGPAAGNALALAYQPRRVFAAAVSIAWNLALATAFITCGGDWWLHRALFGPTHPHGWLGNAAALFPWLGAVYLAYALLNYPVELWFGYAEERQFGLAKDGVRAWTKDWLIGSAHHGVMFVAGSSFLMLLQALLPHAWVLWTAAALLALFLLATALAADLLPRGLFHIEPADAPTLARLSALAAPLRLPPVLVYGARHLRDFAGGLLGLGPRQVMLLSRSTVTAASDDMLRFVLLHDLGHRHHHHLLLSALAGWAWVMIGLVVGHDVILRLAPAAVGLPPYIAWLALTLTAWMALGEPLLAYLGRRLEYQADRFYLRHGGNYDQMRRALEELARRNLAQSDRVQRRRTIFHPLPSVWNRLFAARRYLERGSSTPAAGQVNGGH